MSDTFGPYRLIVAIDLVIPLVFIGAIGSLVFEVPSGFAHSLPSILIMVILALVGTFFLYVSIMRLSYRIKVGDDYVEEYGINTKRRTISLKEIKSLSKRDYSLGLSVFNDTESNLFAILRIPILLIGNLFSRNTIPMLGVDGQVNFPRFPINPKLADALLIRKSDIVVNKNLRDLLSPELRERLGIELTNIDKIGRGLWYFFISILTIFIIGVVVLGAAALIMLE